MKNGMRRFEFYLIKLEQLLLKSAAEKNPALWLYNNDARTPLFMLEGLSKLYAGLHNKNKFEKLTTHFKLLEDELGAIDYYDFFAKEFAHDARVPSNITEYLHAQSREKIQRLNDLLTEHNWIGNDVSRLKKIRKKLSGADWKNPKEEVKAIAEFYNDEIEELKGFMSANGDGFAEIETQLHAIRRKLRWPSIYAQALQGVVQLTDTNIPDENIKKYLTPEVVNSPFNKMPDAGDNTYLLLFEKNYFLALSWIIADLGRLKDNGLRLLSVTEALQQTEGLNRNAALEKACKLYSTDTTALQKILDEGFAISKKYFEEKNMNKLIQGIVPKKNFYNT